MMHVLQMSNVEVAVAVEHVMTMLTESVTLRQGFKSHGWLSVEHGKENLILSYCCNICAVVIQHHASLMKALLRH